MVRRKRLLPERFDREIFIGRLLKLALVATDDGCFVREIVRKKNAVAVLAYDPATDSCIFVWQERLAMRGGKNRRGMVLEVPAGHLERKNVKAEMVRELIEEIGAAIAEEQLEPVNSGEMLGTSVGWTSEKLALLYVELKPGQLDLSKNKFGLAKEGERITRKMIPARELETMSFQDMKTFALVQWFLRRRAEKRLHDAHEELNAMRRMDARD